MVVSTYFLFSPRILGKMIQFDECAYFLMGWNSTSGKLVVWDSNRGAPKSQSLSFSGIQSESKPPGPKPPINHWVSLGEKTWSVEAVEAKALDIFCCQGLVSRSEEGHRPHSLMSQWWGKFSHASHGRVPISLGGPLFFSQKKHP